MQSLEVSILGHRAADGSMIESLGKAQGVPNTLLCLLGSQALF